MDAKLILVICIAVCTANAFSVEPWLGVHERCNDPSFWCKNEENAKECGVIFHMIDLSFFFIQAILA